MSSSVNQKNWLRLLVYIFKLGATSEDFSTPNPICTSTALLTTYSLIQKGKDEYHWLQSIWYISNCLSPIGDIKVPLYLKLKTRKMKVTPFGEIEKERLDLSKKYKLVEMTAGFWRLTKKCKSNYDPESYIHYLQGKLERPNKKTRESAIVEMFSGL